MSSAPMSSSSSTSKMRDPLTDQMLDADSPATAWRRRDEAVMPPHPGPPRPWTAWPPSRGCRDAVPAAVLPAQVEAAPQVPAVYLPLLSSRTVPAHALLRLHARAGGTG